MPTHKEILEELRNNIGDLSWTVAEGSADVRASSQAIQEQAHAQVHAAENIAEGLKDAGGLIIAAAVVGPFVALIGNAIANRAREINAKTDMINSILSLQTRYTSLSYDFIVERSFASGVDKEGRQSLLNELLHDGIVISRDAETGEVFEIETDNPQLVERQTWLDSIKKVGDGQ